MAWRGRVTIEFCLLSNIASMAFIGLFGTSDVLYTYRVGYTAFLSLPFLTLGNTVFGNPHIDWQTADPGALGLRLGVGASIILFQISDDLSDIGIHFWLFSHMATI